MHIHAGTALHTVILEKLSRERGSTMRIVSFDREHIRARGRQQERRCRSRRANAPEPSSRRSPQIEYAEVEACIGLDADCALAFGIVRTQEALLTSLPPTMAAWV